MKLDNRIVCVCMCVCVCVSVCVCVWGGGGCTYICLVLLSLLPLILNVGHHLLQLLILTAQCAMGLGSLPTDRTQRRY